MTRLRAGHWTIATALALALHGVAAVLLAHETPPSGARAAGTGGLTVDLSAGGAAPGAVPAAPAAAAAETLPPQEADQLLPVRIEAETAVPEAAAGPTPIVESPVQVAAAVPDAAPPDAMPVLPRQTEPRRVPDAAPVQPAEIKPVDAVDPPPPPVPEATPQPPTETVTARAPAQPPPPKPRPDVPAPVVASAPPAPTQQVAAVPAPAGAAGEAGSSDAGAAAPGAARNRATGGGLAGAPADYLTHLQAWLEKHKEYPHRARQRRQQGTALLYFVMDRDGHVLDYRVRRTSGHPALDEAVEQMIRRAQPLPPLPPDMVQARLELLVPVRFELR